VIVAQKPIYSANYHGFDYTMDFPALQQIAKKLYRLTQKSIRRQNWMMHKSKPRSLPGTFN